MKHTMVLNLLLCFLFSFILQSCSTINCKIEERSDKVMNTTEKTSSDSKDLTQRIFIYKPDGSLQCGMGQKIDPSEMRKELGTVETFSAENKHDGLMRVQLCGHATGNCNVYQIKLTDLDLALKLGFKKWLRD